jgi:hypothetical protein
VRSFFKKKRAQAAIELLTTYGWAILSVFVVIGAMAYFDVFDSSRFISEKCDTGSQIQCIGAYANDRGEVEIQIRNNYLVDIDIENVYIDNVRTTFTTEDVLGEGRVTLSPGEISKIHPISSSSFRNLHSGVKEEFQINITFRRYTPNNQARACGTAGGATCYNITGKVIAKVHNEAKVPLNPYPGYQPVN